METDTEVFQILPYQLNERIFNSITTDAKAPERPQQTISDQIAKLSEENEGLSLTLGGFSTLLEESSEKAKNFIMWMKANNVAEGEVDGLLNEVAKLVEDHRRLNSAREVESKSSEETKQAIPILRESWAEPVSNGKPKPDAKETIVVTKYREM